MTTKYILFLDKEGRINFGMEGSDKFAKLIKDTEGQWCIDEKQFDKSLYFTIANFIVNFNVFLHAEKNLNLGLAIACPAAITLETLEDAEQIDLTARTTFYNAVIEIIKYHQNNFEYEIYENIALSSINIPNQPLQLPFAIHKFLKKMDEAGITMRKLNLSGFCLPFIPDNLPNLHALEIKGGNINFTDLAKSLQTSSVRRFVFHNSRNRVHIGSPFEIIASNYLIEDFDFCGDDDDDSFPDDFTYDELNRSPALLRLVLSETTLLSKPLEKNIFISLLSQANLLRLNLHGIELSKNKSLLILLNKSLKTNKTLTSLDLGLNELEDEHLKVLSNGLSTTPNLQNLDLSFNDLGVSSVNIITKILEKNRLNTLSLASNNNLDDDFLLQLSGQLKPCKNLTNLDLDMSGETFKWYTDKGLLAVFTALQQPKINLRKLKYAYLGESMEEEMSSRLKETYIIATIHLLQKNKLTEFNSTSIDLYHRTIKAYKVRNKHNQNRTEYYVGGFAILVAFVKANLNHRFQHSVLPLINVILNLLEENNIATIGTLNNEKTTALNNLPNDEKYSDARTCLKNLMPLRSASPKFFDKLIVSQTFINLVNEPFSTNTKKRKK